MSSEKKIVNSELVSIIVPAYNSEKNIGKMIRSLVAQKGVEIEIVVVDDASTDNTLSIIRDLAEEDSRIKVLAHEENKGAHFSRVYGLKESIGRYIGFADADDYVASNMYEKLLCHIKEADSCIAVCSVGMVSESGRSLKFAPKFRRDRVVEVGFLNDLMTSRLGPAYLCNKLYKREVIDYAFSLEFPWRQSLNEDMIVNIACFYKARKICIVSEVLYFYLKNPDSIVRSAKRADRYVEHIKAFSIALTFYGELSEELNSLIYRFYRGYISRKGFFIENVSDLDCLSSEMDKVLLQLEKVDRFALIRLCARSEDIWARGKGFRVRANKFIDKYVLKRNMYEYIE